MPGTRPGTAAARGRRAVPDRGWPDRRSRTAPAGRRPAGRGVQPAQRGGRARHIDQPDRRQRARHRRDPAGAVRDAPEFLLPLAAELLWRGAFERGSQAAALAQRNSIDPGMHPELAVRLALVKMLYCTFIGQFDEALAHREWARPLRLRPTGSAPQNTGRSQTPSSRRGAGQQGRTSHRSSGCRGYRARPARQARAIPIIRGHGDAVAYRKNESATAPGHSRAYLLADGEGTHLHPGLVITKYRAGGQVDE